MKTSPASIFKILFKIWWIIFNLIYLHRIVSQINRQSNRFKFRNGPDRHDGSTKINSKNTHTHNTTIKKSEITTIVENHHWKRNLFYSISYHRMETMEMVLEFQMRKFEHKYPFHFRLSLEQAARREFLLFPHLWVLQPHTFDIVSERCTEFRSQMGPRARPLD